nr:L polymerase [unidentified Reptarenavirus]AKH49140.1 L polymerase [unidentified Reptarenavirus]AKH49148.1 L polymerase [unidentified Reptarenavirus]AKH49168.1 L polymerase [unidentified Reptarenavirus]
MGSLCPEDAELGRLKELVLGVLTYERDLYKPGWIVDSAGGMAVSAIKLRSTIHELNCCRDIGLKFNGELKEMNELLDEAIGLHETIKTIIPDGYLIDKTNNIISVLEASTRSEPSDQNRKVDLDRQKYNGIQELLRPKGWSLTVVTISERKPRLGEIPESLMFKLLSTSLSILSYATDTHDWISEEDYLELKRSLTSYDFRTLTEEFKGQDLMFDIESVEDPYKHILDWMLENEDKLPFSLDWKGPEITKSIQDFKREVSQLRLLEIMRHSKINLTLKTGHLSSLNKLKSLNLLNTRRKQNKVYDYLALTLFVTIPDKQDFPSGWFPSVNDRLVSVDSVDLTLVTYKRLIEKMICSLQNLIKEIGSRQKVEELSGLIRYLEESRVGLVEPTVLKEAYQNLSLNGGIPQPEINLKIINDYPVKPQTMNINAEESETIEKVALNLILSQKTRSTPKASLKEEFYFQSIGGCLLLYRCTGEGQRAYSLLCNTGEEGGNFFSFNINPSRLFPLIFSAKPISDLVDQLMMLVNPIHDEIDRLKDTIEKQESVNSFLISSEYHEEQLDELRVRVKYLIYGILTNPTKRLQVELQSQRYYIMDTLSIVHHKDLEEKVVGNCITYNEYFLRNFAHELINEILTCKNIGLFLKVSWGLNISYLCHLITKETPDRLSDLRDCYEKFFKPKFKFMGNLIHDCKDVDELVSQMEAEVDNFIQSSEPSFEIKPFLYEPVLADFLKWISTEKFNGLDGEQLLDPKDYLTSNVDVLDLTSNKSTFKRSKKSPSNGNLDQQYDMNKILKRVISERLHKRVVHSKKRDEIENHDKFKVKKIDDKRKSAKWGAGGERRKASKLAFEEFSEIVQGLIVETESEDDLNTFLLQINGCLQEINDDLEGSRQTEKEHNIQPRTKYELVLGVISQILGPEVRDLVRSTCYSTKLSDLPCDLLKEESYCEIVKETMQRLPLEFPESADTIDVSNISAGMVVAKYDSGEYFSSFKFLLLWAGFNNFQGTYDHRSGPQSTYLSLSNKYRGESMISTRITNSEALQDRLLAIRHGAPTLRNVLFSTLNLEISKSEVGPNNKPLQFGLAIKEQVGGPRELYVGDSDTKLITRVLEETSRNLGSKLPNSCLNSDKKFTNFMKRIARSFFENEIVLSMDHSKWGPFNSPLQYHLMFEAMESITDLNGKALDFSFVKTILKWHLFKAVETPQILAEDVVLSALDISMGRRERSIEKERVFETFMVNAVLSNKSIPSQIHSWFDMGQGILHHTSDLYGSLASEYITKKIKDLFCVRSSTMNTSDDMVLLFHLKYRNNDPEQKDKLLSMINFFCLVSNCLNKHISPKFCCSPLVGEFKSHFEVEATMVPLFTKFFSASLNNFRCKTPMELYNTCDAIVEQGICNGMSLKLADSMKERMVDMLRWLGYVDDPLMKPIETRQQDWLEGCLSFRKLRSLEAWLVEVGVEKIQLEVLKLDLLKIIKEMRESSISPSTAYKMMVEASKVVLGEIVQWFPTLHGEFKLIVRSKLNLGTTINETCENLLIKKLINHYSRYSKQGLGLLIAEGLERSAFQSSVVTGFIGLSISLSGSCVRKGDGTFLNLRDSKVITKPVAEVFPSLVMQSVCAVGDWVCGSETTPDKENNKSIYMRTSLVNTAEFRFGLDELTAAIEMSMPDLFDKYLKDIVPPDKRLLMRHSWKIRPEMELLIECAKEGLSVFDGRIDRQEEAVVLVDFFQPKRLIRRVINREKRGPERTIRRELQAITNRMILNSVLEPKIIDKVTVLDATKLAPFEGSMHELKSYHTSGIRRYIQQVLLGRDTHYRQREDEPIDISSNDVVIYARGAPEEPLSDGTWVVGARLGTKNPIKLQCSFQKISSDLKVKASLITHEGRAHLQDFIYLKRAIISDDTFDEPELIDLLELNDVTIVECPKPSGRPCFLFMGCIIPLESSSIKSIMTQMSESEWDELWKLVRTFFITRMKGEIECLPRPRLKALEGMVRQIFGVFSVEKVFQMGFQLLDSFVEFLTLTDRIFITRGPTLVFHRSEGVLVGSPVGSLLYKGHRLMSYADWALGGPKLRELED